MKRHPFKYIVKFFINAQVLIVNECIILQTLILRFFFLSLFQTAAVVSIYFKHISLKISDREMVHKCLNAGKKKKKQYANAPKNIEWLV